MHLHAAFKIDNPRIDPLVDGKITLPDVEWRWELGHPGELFLRQMRENGFDVFEFSLAEFLILRNLPRFAHLDWVALPIFPNKAFLQMDLRVHQDAGIRDFSDLAGKRVALPDFQMTAAIWLRIMLRVLHDIRPQDIQWVNGRPPSRRHGSELGVDRHFLSSIPVVNLGESDSVNTMLHAHAVDAAFGDRLTVPLENGGTVAPLFTPDEKRRVVAAFYAKAGCLPVNHGVFIQRRILDVMPDFGSRLYAAFAEAKAESYRRARYAMEAFFLFPDGDWDRQTKDFGPDPYPYGLDSNRPMLDLLAGELLDEGFIPERPDWSKIFLPVD